jgi:8-oxo-dGTP diphosphatase
MTDLVNTGKRLLLVAACALVDADGRVLLAQRPPGKQLAGLWEFPGGKVEPGETPEQCIIRELHEEIGIETEIPCLAPLTFASHSYDDFHLLMPLFVCRRRAADSVPHRPALRICFDAIPDGKPLHTFPGIALTIGTTIHISQR